MTHSGDRENLPRFAELDGDYEILRELGRGGTAVVYLAQERVLSRLVAIKVIRSTYIEDEEAVARLMREARTVGGMQHPNIVVLYGTRRLGDGSLALIMQYIPGGTLRKEIQSCGGLPFERVHRILTDVGRALAHAHRQSIVHRDVKPENIYVEEESGMARLSDFGIARAWDVDSDLTLPGTAIGTPAYMSPEQIDGGEVDGRSDLFSLGLVGYEMLTGTRPWAGESLYSVIAKQKNTQLPSLKERRSGIPAALQLAIEGALRKDREARWQTANEFLTALGSPPEAERVEEPASPFAELISVERTPLSAAAAPAAGTPSTSQRDNETVVWRPPVAPPATATPAPSATPASETIITPPPAAVKTRKRSHAGRRRLAVLIGAAVVVVVTLATAAVSLTTGQDSPETAVVDDDAVPAAPVPESAADPAPPPAAEVTENAPPPPAVDVAPHTVSARAALLYAVFGDGQQGPAGVALGKPLMVRVVDAGGRAVEGATVHFTVTAGAGSVKPTMALTNRDGVAATRWVPRTVGVHRAQARVDGLGAAIAFSARALPGPKASPRRSNVARREPVRQPPVRRRETSAATTARSTTPSTGASNLSRSTRAPSTLGAAPTGLTVRREVAAGGRHSCTLNGSGLALCWGSGEAGQLGGRPVGPAAAVHVTTEEPFTMLAAGATHTCAIAGSGRAFCWGGNGAGQLGDGTRVSRAAPERVRVTDRLTSITVGLQHTCAIDSTGQISCWGQNNRGQLGDRTKADRALAVRVAGRGTFRNVAAGWTHTCAVGTDGTAYCWGSNRFGELGDSDGGDHAAPTAVAGGHRFSSIAAGNGFSCGLRTDGAVLCWGDNTHGQLGNGSTSLSVMPVEILAATRFTDIAAGAAHACAISWDGTAYCWGQNDYGQLGDGTMQDRLSPTVVVGGHRFSAISASAAHSCATATNGRSLCWGSNRDGQVGDVPRTVQTRPVPAAN